MLCKNCSVIYSRAKYMYQSGFICSIDRLFLKHNFTLVFDTCVSFTLFSKTIDPLVTKNFSKKVNNTNFGFLIVKADVCAVAMAASISINGYIDQYIIGPGGVLGISSDGDDRMEPKVKTQKNP